jgi:hypothetical protein
MRNGSKNALIGFVRVVLRLCGRFFHRRALRDGRTGQLGVVERLVRSGPEPDVSAAAQRSCLNWLVGNQG